MNPMGRFNVLVFVALTILLLAGVVVIAADDDGSGDSAEAIQSLESEIKSVEERRLIVQLREQKQKNMQQAKALKKEKNELNLLRLEVDKKLDALQLLRKEIEALLVEKNEIEQGKILELSQMYNKMDVVRAALIIKELDRELAIGILGGMKAKSAGKILASIGGKEAAILSTAYSTLKED